MLDQRFYHEVLSPYFRLLIRSAENICVQQNNSDIIALAQEAATSAYHFPETIRGTGAWADPAVETLRQMLGDVVDTKKHGDKLRNADRVVKLSSFLEFEFNDTNKIRYLGTGVSAKNTRFGEFSLISTIRDFVRASITELSIPLDATITLPRYPWECPEPC
ncbi:hypothetical protein [Afipia sp. DC4300-2b1]|uniref:hypothetical protein n=1 Tax=Afipia sp. DC4300-2b1 TaxID=2804672 RepID=UPI003CFB2FFE